jgi:plasmid maintenance system antidote protein VapI
MSRKNFVAALAQLGYEATNAHELLGISRSTVYRIIAGTTKVPPVVEKLLDMYARHGVPGEKR